MTMEPVEQKTKVGFWMKAYLIALEEVMSQTWVDRDEPDEEGANEVSHIAARIADESVKRLEGRAFV